MAAQMADPPPSAWASSVSPTSLFPCFQPAAAILRVARALGELDESLLASSGGDAVMLDQFFKLLDATECHLREQQQQQQQQLSSNSCSSKRPSCGNTNRPFVCVVEGLDGSGKSSLVEALAGAVGGPPPTCAENGTTGLAMATPTATMTPVRCVFDKCGGKIARAFYMVSNYVLQYEIDCLMEQPAADGGIQKRWVVVVDRWYASTAAYSIAYKNSNPDATTSEGPESIDALPRQLFQWPVDLRPPHLMLLLSLDDSVRRERVRLRAKPEDHNPWDARLNADLNLGRRIFRVFETMQGPGELLSLDASLSQEDVLSNALSIVQDRVARHFDPVQYFGRKPLDYFCYSIASATHCLSQRGGQHSTTGVRLHQTAQLAQNSTIAGGPPSLRSVEVCSVDNSGILLLSTGHGSDGDSSNLTALAVSSITASHTSKEQWSAQGILVPVSLEEYDLLTSQPRRDASNNNKDIASFLRFIPLRMELLSGGGCRYKWSRTNDSKTAHLNGWGQARDMLAPLFGSPPTLQRPLWPVTLVLTGGHCSGKATLGERIANLLGWQFQSELGDKLRETIVESGHRVGDGSGKANALAWDDLVRNAEIKRDSESKSSRVVESWHPGNFGWALFRSKSRRLELVDLVKSAVSQQCSKSLVLFVHLTTTVDTCFRRRKTQTNFDRLPMAAENEKQECNDLHKFLDESVVALLRNELRDAGTPLLEVDNSLDGEDSMKDSTRRIIQFINENLWRRATCG